MIVVEDRLAEIFAYLPEMSYSVGSTLFKPVFRYGNQVELAAFLKAAETDGFSPYPLIWLLYPINENHNVRGRKVTVQQLTLILAVNSSKVALNPERMETTFKKVLIPLYDNIETAFKSASSINASPEVEIIKFPNYSGDRSDGDSNFTVDRWDALKTIWNVSINDVCLRPLTI